MKFFAPACAGKFFRALLLLTAVVALALPARAGLTFNLQVYQYASQGNYTYYFDPQLNTNATAPSVPFGDYYLASYGIPTNGSSSLWRFDTNGFNQNQAGSVRYSYGDYNSMLHELTNGLWSLSVTNASATNVYTFAVAVNITSNDLPKVLITNPANGAGAVTNQPVISWQGPADYSSLTLTLPNSSTNLPVSETSYTNSTPWLEGVQAVTVLYVSNSLTAAVATTPTNSAGQVYPGWASASTLTVSYQSMFSVGLPDTSGGYRALVACYPFDVTSGSVLDAGADVSGNGNSLRDCFKIQKSLDFVGG